MPEDAELGAGRTCFIVSPIGSKLEPLGSPGRSRYEESTIMWEEVFLPACEQFGLEPIRSDKISIPGEIPDQIFGYLRDADVVIADLSHGNANVMYELGLRHSRPGITIQVGEYERLPFDLSTIRTIQFNRTAAGRIGARNDLVEALRAALLSGSTGLRSTAIFAEGAVVEEQVESDVAKSLQPEAVTSVDEPGLIDLLAEGEAGIGRIGETLVEATEDIQTLGVISTAGVDSLAASDSQGKGFAGRLLVSRELARDLMTPSLDLERLATDYFDAVGSVDVMIGYIVRRMTDDDSERKSGQEFLKSIAGLATAAAESAVGLTGFRESVREMRKLSKDLAAPSRTIDGSITRFLEGITIIEGWGESISGLID